MLYLLAVQALYDARPDIQQQFPGGVIQFAQVAVQLGEDFWDNLMHPMMLDDLQLGNAAMPGGLGDLGLEDSDDELEDNVVEHAGEGAQAIHDAANLGAQQHDVGRDGDDGGDGDDDDEVDDEVQEDVPVRVPSNSMCPQKDKQVY